MCYLHIPDDPCDQLHFQLPHTCNTFKQFVVSIVSQHPRSILNRVQVYIDECSIIVCLSRIQEVCILQRFSHCECVFVCKTIRIETSPYELTSNHMDNKFVRLSLLHPFSYPRILQPYYKPSIYKSKQTEGNILNWRKPA